MPKFISCREFLEKLYLWEFNMQLEQFLRRHYDDYVYLRKSDGTAIMDIMVKFVPLWILETYGQCEIDVIERPAGESPKFRVYDLMCFKRCEEQDE